MARLLPPSPSSPPTALFIYYCSILWIKYTYFLSKLLEYVNLVWPSRAARANNRSWPTSAIVIQNLTHYLYNVGRINIWLTKHTKTWCYYKKIYIEPFCRHVKSWYLQVIPYNVIQCGLHIDASNMMTKMYNMMGITD